MGEVGDYEEDYGYMLDDPDYIYAEESWDLAVSSSAMSHIFKNPG